MRLTSPQRDLLARIKRNTAHLRRRRQARPLDYIRWLPGQLAFLSDSAKLKLFRAGNQSQGKTWAGLAETHFRCIGEHPYIDVPKAPIEAWIVCASWSQCIAIQKKFWTLVGGTGELHEETSFDPVKGFRGKNPAVRYKNGSIVRFKTTNQGGLSLAGATIDFALFDEPPKDQRIFGEVQKRVMRKAGTVALTLTPINAPVDWLKKMVEDGVISDHHYRFEAKNLIPVGASKPLRLADGSPMDEAFVERIRRETLPREAPVVLDGEWETREEGRLFAAFDEAVHVAGWCEPPEGAWIGYGADHGDGSNFSQYAVLVAVDASGKWPRVWIWDEWVSQSMTTEDLDAAASLVMLRRNGLMWRHLDSARGDRKHGGRKGGLGRKSNNKLMKAIAAEMKVPFKDLKPRIRTVKKGFGQNQGSVSQGCKFLHEAQVRPGHFFVHPRCTRFIESAKKWDYKATSEWKHAIDGVRYALWPHIFPRAQTSRGAAGIRQR